MVIAYERWSRREVRLYFFKIKYDELKYDRSCCAEINVIGNCCISFIP